MRLWMGLWASTAMAVPMTMQQQGRLLDPAGGPIDGNVDLQFSLYDAESDGQASFVEDHPGVLVQDGYYTVTLGSRVPLDAADLAGDRWLEVQVGGTTMPRTPLGSVPYAIRAESAAVADSLGGVVTLHPGGGVRIGNTILNAYTASIPGSFNGTGYASGNLQMKTALTCGNADDQSIMWNLEFVGHDYNVNQGFKVVVVGYSQHAYPDEIQNLGSHVIYGSVTVNQYCSSDDQLSFELRRASGQWHASDLVVNVMHGASGYEGRFSDGWGVLEVREGALLTYRIRV